MRFLLFLLLISNLVQAQDSLVFLNGDRMAGEIKSMDRGVITIETDYSDKDFTLKWKEIREVHTGTMFIITLSDGSRHVGTLLTKNDRVTLTHNGSSYSTTLNDIVYMKSVSERFWDKIKASISLGYSLTKAQNLKQFSLRSNVSFIEEKWLLDLSFNNIRSTQDEVDPIHRTDGGATFTFFLPKDWYIPMSLSFLSNTEQQLDLRLLGKAGIGKYVIHKNNAYLGFSVGANVNLEKYYDASTNRNSWESYLGAELNLFDIGDLSLLSRIVLYPSITESGRVRSDFNFDAKYDLPLDFYIQAGITVNYDNQPVENSPGTDYVTQLTFGWKW